MILLYIFLIKLVFNSIRFTEFVTFVKIVISFQTIFLHLVQKSKVLVSFVSAAVPFRSSLKTIYSIGYKVRLIRAIFTFDHIISIFFSTLGSKTIHQTHEHVEPHTPNRSCTHSNLTCSPFNVNNVPSKVILSLKYFFNFYLSRTSNLSAKGMLSVFVCI